MAADEFDVVIAGAGAGGGFAAMALTEAGLRVLMLERGPFPTPAHQLTTRSQLIKRGADQLGWSLLPNTLALPTESVDGRSPCQHTGGCGLGYPFGAKSSTDLTAIARAERTSRLTLRGPAGAN